MLLPRHHPDYPALLRRAPGPPDVLHVAGDPLLLWHPAVAIVGSRSPSAAGIEHAHAFARALAQAGFCIVSGMAAGIDAAAHRGALSVHGRTVAVLGCGVDVAYPPTNRDLHRQIREHGAVVSEYPDGAKAFPFQFPRRNRIVAGLSLGTVVIEAAQRSGALITARLAAEAGREVFALPGSIHNPMARGCHRLIREGAALIESPGEVIEALAPIARTLADALRGRLEALPQREGRSPSAPTSSALEVPRGTALPAPQADDPKYQRLWKALGHDPTGMDALVSRTGLTAAELSSMLLLMELDGFVAVQHGRYSRKR
jgi:DNA processing protein